MDQALRALSLVLLLGAVHVAPLLAAARLGERWAAPIDGGRVWRDGRPLLGPHKTWRGLAAAMAGGALGGLVLGPGALAGVAAGALGMLGDLSTSFAKRRLGLGSGRDVPLLDHLVEGMLPALLLAPRLGLTPAWTAVALGVFCAAAYGLTLFSKRLVRSLRGGPSDRLRSVRGWGIVRARFKEFASCRSGGVVGTLLNLRELLIYRVLVTAAFGAVGLYRAGRENALGVGLTELDLCFDDLPPAFDGYRVLFAADLHLDGLDGLTERLVELVRGESPDLVLLGGDYRFATHGPSDEAMRRLGLFLSALRPPDGTLAVLGNHDCEAMIAPLRDMGARVLMGESARIERGAERIDVVGLDDPSIHGASSAREACGAIADAFTIMLVHTPEAHAEAAACGMRLYLCGHTHAGQISLPGLGPLITLSRSPRRLARGLWRQGRMLGYTTSGAGVSGSPLRFGTRGEVVRVTLRRLEHAREERSCSEPAPRAVS